MGHRAGSSKQAGFSLLELIVALAVMLIIMSVVLTLMRDSIGVSVTTYELTEAGQNVRAAQEFINRDLVTAGDGLKDVNNIRLPMDFVTTYLTTAPVTNISTPDKIILPIITSDDDVAENTQVSDTVDPVTVRTDPVQTDRITILEIDPNFTPISLDADAIDPSVATVTVSDADIDRFNEGEVYFISSSDGATFGAITLVDDGANVLTFDATDDYGLNDPGDDGTFDLVTRGGTLTTSLMRMRLIHYFVNSEGLLIRRIFGVGGGVGFLDEVIAEHVTNLQFRYGLNIRVNGLLQQPVPQLTTAIEQAAIRHVEVAITVETVHPVTNGQNQEITSTTSTSVRNLQFREALQPKAPTEDE